MAEYDFDMGVIGGGSGGLTVTAGAAQFGAKTLLVENTTLKKDSAPWVQRWNLAVQRSPTSTVSD
jgi:glycerol-3-phosphate dehydrogenase